MSNIRHTSSLISFIFYFLGMVLLQTAVGNPDKALGSAPTFSRLESHFDISNVKRLNKVLFDSFINSYRKPPKEIILDFDASDIPIYGNQESKEYHGYYGSYCYLPLYVYCGDDMVACHLRNSRIDGAKHADEGTAQDSITRDKISDSNDNS